MEFLQPYWLWGVLAVAIPVAIHFWNQKKGKTIEWAASRWLLDKTTLNHRGIRLHEIPLMLLRCLLVMLLTFILGKPILNRLNEAAGNQSVHLVQPDRRVVENYRFELEAALKKGEKMYWIGLAAGPVEDLTNIPNVSKPELYVQQVINKTAGVNHNVQLYFLANQRFIEIPKIYIPGAFQLFTLADSSGTDEEALKFDPEKKWNVLLEYQNTGEQATARAALNALSAVYGITFNIDLTLNPGKKYELILTDHIQKPVDLQALYVVSGQIFRPDLPDNVKQLPDSLLTSSSSLVETGRLPEWLGEVLVQHFDLEKKVVPVSENQLRAMFEQTKPSQEAGADEMRKWLLLCFVLATFLERWVSLRKTTGAHV